MFLIGSAVALGVNVINLHHVTVAASARRAGRAILGEDFVTKFSVLDVGHFNLSSVSIINVSSAA